jgi:type IV pilus assembly protein PilX
MNNLAPNNHRKSSIIVITLILLVVMTSMGVGLYYSTKHTAKQVGVSGSRVEALYTAESCTTEAIHWLETTGLSGPPCKGSSKGSVCKPMPSKRMDQWGLGGENSTQKNRMNAHRYNCNISLLGTISTENDTGVGFDVSQSGSYGGSSSNTKYLYKIISKANGSNNLSSEVEIVVSMIF